MRNVDGVRTADLSISENKNPVKKDSAIFDVRTADEIQFLDYNGQRRENTFWAVNLFTIRWQISQKYVYVSCICREGNIPGQRLILNRLFSSFSLPFISR